MTKPTLTALKKIRKKYGLSDTDPITVAQYREACGIATAKDGKWDFVFEYVLVQRTEDRAIVHIYGDHLSKNRIDAMRLGEKMRYKNAFKKGAEALYLLNKEKLKAYAPMRYAVIHFLFATKRSRDHDNNSENIKRVQDTMIRLGIIADDSRDHLMLGGIEERVCKKGEKTMIEVVIERRSV